MLVVLVVYLAAILSFFFFRDFFVIDVTARLGENVCGHLLPHLCAPERAKA